MNAEMAQFEEIVEEVNAAHAEAQESLKAGKQPFIKELTLFAGVTAVMCAAQPAELLRYAMTESFSREMVSHLAVLMYRIGRKHAETEMAQLNRLME
jgi:hypothetical protein